jgi:hypothetical protein
MAPETWIAIAAALMLPLAIPGTTPPWFWASRPAGPGAPGHHLRPESLTVNLRV